MRIGGFCVSMVRICTGEVWVRRSLRLVPVDAVQEERVVHLARRMALGEIQRGEIVIVGLDVRTLGDREAHVAEDRGDLVDHLADRMDAAALGRRLPDRQRHVDLFGGEPRGDRGILEFGLARAERLGDAVLQAVDGRALGLPLLRRHRAQRLQQLGDRALLAERGNAHRLDRLLVGGRGDLGHQGIFECFHFAHVPDPIGLCGHKEKPAPALPARVSQIRIVESLGRRWLRQQRFQKRSGWCS